MSNFVHCRGCAHQIHESALVCPKCGAPQIVAGAGVAPDGESSEYSQVPFFRRRWFIVLCLLTITPIAAVVAATGDIFYDAKGVVKKFDKNVKISTYFASIAYLFALFSNGSVSYAFLFATVVVSLIIGFKK